VCIEYILWWNSLGLDDFNPQYALFWLLSQISSIVSPSRLAPSQFSIFNYQLQLYTLVGKSSRCSSRQVILRRQRGAVWYRVEIETNISDSLVLKFLLVTGHIQRVPFASTHTFFSYSLEEYELHRNWLESLADKRHGTESSHKRWALIARIKHSLKPTSNYL